jgi:hypothetical protein
MDCTATIHLFSKNKYDTDVSETQNIFLELKKLLNIELQTALKPARVYYFS